MTISDVQRGKNKLGPLEQASLTMLEDILVLLASDHYLDMLEELVDISDIELDSKEGDVIFCNRMNTAEEKMMIRVGRALLNMYTDRPDKLVRLATHGDS